VTDEDTNKVHLVEVPSDSDMAFGAVEEERLQSRVVPGPAPNGDWYAPSGAAFAVADTLLVVCDTYNDRVVVVDVATLAAVQSIPSPWHPASVAAGRDLGGSAIFLMKKATGPRYRGGRCLLMQHALGDSNCGENWQQLCHSVDGDNCEAGVAVCGRSGLVAVTEGETTAILVFCAPALFPVTAATGKPTKSAQSKQAS
jgi:YVTN family beta-propeller protein